MPKVVIMLKHPTTLAMSIIGDLMIVIGCIAIGGSIGTSIIGLALLAIGIGAEVNLWRRSTRAIREV